MKISQNPEGVYDSLELQRNNYKPYFRTSSNIRLMETFIYEFPHLSCFFLTVEPSQTIKQQPHKSEHVTQSHEHV